MRKGKKLSRADVLKILRKAKRLIEDYQHDFICCSILEAKMGLGIYDDNISALNVIPELIEYRPFGRMNGDPWWPSSEREIRLNVLEDLISRYERMKPDTLMDRIRYRIKNIFKK